MGRGKVKLQLIENGARRADCFSKRRRGLLKKARELAEFCNAEVAVVIFSAKGKLSYYSSQSSLENTFERYRKFLDAETEVKNAVAVRKGIKFADTPTDHGLRADQRSLNDGFVEKEINNLEMLEESLENDLRKVRLIKAALLNDFMINHWDQVIAAEEEDTNEEEEEHIVRERDLGIYSSSAAASQPGRSRTLQLFRDL